MPVCSTTVRLPQDKHKVVRVDRGWRFWIRNLYVAIRNEIPRPVTKEQFIEAEWNKIIREDLALHLRNINNEIRYACQGRSTRESLLEPELLLTGHEIGSSISLSPKIWFRCGSTWVEKVVRKETYGLSWMADRGLGDRIETGLESAVLVSDNPIPIPVRLKSLLESGLAPTSKLPYGYTLHISTQKIPAYGSPSGLLCSVLVKKHQDVVHHSTCRIGGIITIHDSQQPRPFAVTTAHGLLDYFLRDVADQHTDDTNSYFRMAGDAMATAASFATSSLSLFFGAEEDPPAKTASSSKAHGIISEKELEEIEWEPVKRVAHTNWLGGGWESGTEFQHPFFTPEPDRLTPDADFALLELSSETYHNFYVNEVVQNSTQRVKDWLADDELEPGAVEVILGGSGQPSATDSVAAHLLHERPHLFLRGAPFPTRKLRLTQPLASGTSGAWVVRGKDLCGMIVASYDTEPFAHMITAEKMLADMKKTLGTMFVGQPMIGLSIPDNRMPLTRPISPLSSELDVLDEVASGSRRKRRSVDSATFMNPSSATSESKEPSPYKSVHELRNNLYEAFNTSAFHESGKFLPFKSLKRVLTEPVVVKSILQVFEDRSKAGQLANYVFDPGEERSCLKIYGILVLLDKVRDLEKFADARINDQHLPFSLAVSKSEDTRLESSAGTERHQRRPPPSFLLEWNYAEIDLFNSYQWYFLSPYFARSREGSIFHYSLQDNVILPWTEMEVEDAEGLSIVQKVKIHPSSHDLPGFEDPNAFAVKQYRSNDPNDFVHEVDILKRLKGNDSHFVNLLATFKHRNSYQMIFPWVSGGSLSDFWRQHTAVPPIQAALPWFVNEALSLAKGLSILHNPPEGPPIMHGDLKAENVLLLKHGIPNEEIGGSLKIADFGCAGIVTPEDPQKIYSFSRTYRPPEIDGSESLLVSLDYDIWTLGCLYLEFICWLLMGAQGLVDFTDSRLQEERGEHNPLNGYVEDKFFKSTTIDLVDSEFRGLESSLTFELKDSVLECITRLRNLPACNDTLQSFLDLIQENMLLTDPSDRLGAEMIADKIASIKADFHVDDNQDASHTGSSAAGNSQYNSEVTSVFESSKEITGSEVLPQRDDPQNEDDISGKGFKHDNAGNDRDEDLIPIDVQTIDEFIAETVRQTETHRLILRRTVKHRHLWNTQNVIYQAAVADGGKRYETYRHDYSNRTRAELDDVKMDSFARIAAVNHVVGSGRVIDSKGKSSLKENNATPQPVQISGSTESNPSSKSNKKGGNGKGASEANNDTPQPPQYSGSTEAGPSSQSIKEGRNKTKGSGLIQTAISSLVAISSLEGRRLQERQRGPTKQFISAYRLPWHVFQEWLSERFDGYSADKVRVKMSEDRYIVEAPEELTASDHAAINRLRKSQMEDDNPFGDSE